VSRRLVSLVVLLACATAGTATAARPKSWADAAIRTVVARGLMADDPASFRPDDALTRGEAAALVAALTGRQSSRVAVARPDAPLDMQGLNAHLVAALGLQDAARAATAAAKAAGLAPPARFGNEVVARLLSLRTNHPAAQDALERQPTEPAPRAEAAHSVAKILAFSGAEAANARSTLATFALPALSDWQRRVLAKAVELIGRPYVWGGTSDGPQSMSGKPGPGGYDCSGVRLACVQAAAVPGRRGARRDAARPDDLRDERRGGEGEANSGRTAPARGRRLLRRQGEPLEAERDRSHGYLSRERLAHPLLEPGRRAGAAHGLVRAVVRLGAPAARGGGADAGGVTIRPP
jgi:cell wall-associated NlpC family hydrolase